MGGMKDRLGAVLRPAQERYLERLLPPRDELLREMEERAEREDIPISDPEVGRLLGLLARSSGASLIVEVGTAIGYGTLCLARGAPEARVLTIDHDPERLAVAREYLRRGEVLDRVDLVEGDALAVLGRIDAPVGLAYVDTAKPLYRRCLDMLLPRLSIGGLLAFDNLLWKGWIAEPPDEEDGEEDADSVAIRAFNPYLMIHPQLQSVILPLGDGVGLATKIQPTLLELGGPF